MKIGKLDKQQKLFDLYKVLGTMFRIESVNGDIVLDDELKAVVFAAVEPVLKKRIAKGALLPVFEGDTAMQIDVFPEEDAYAVGVGETPLGLDVPVEASVKESKRKKYLDGFEKP